MAGNKCKETGSEKIHVPLSDSTEDKVANKNCRQPYIGKLCVLLLYSAKKGI
jgi:hypothetical protein